MKNLFSLFFLFVFVSSGFGQWQKTEGPFHSEIVSFGTQGNNLFAIGIFEGVYISTDKGMSWNLSKQGLPTTGIGYYTIEIKGNRLLLGTTKGIYQSLDSGKTWKSESAGLPNFNFTRSVYIGDSATYSGSNNGVFILKNGSSKWDSSSVGLPKYTNVRDIFRKDSTLFIATSKGVFYSHNDGLSWTKSVSGLPTFASYYSIAISNNELFASSNLGVHSSIDHGINWTTKSTGLSTSAKLYLHTNQGKIYAGGVDDLFVSSNQGNTWKLIQSGRKKFEAEEISVSAIYTDGAEILTGGIEGLQHSSDSGKNWVPINSGFPYARSLSLTSNGTDVYTGTHRGLFSSADGGKTWVQQANGSISSVEAYGDVVLYGMVARYVYSSTHKAKNFVRSTGFNDNSQDVMAAAGPYVFGQTNRSSINPLFGFVSSDTGRTFKMLRMRYNIFAEQDSKVIFAIDSMVSKYDGSNWIAQSTSIKNNKAFSLGVNQSTLLVGTSGGVLRSNINGNSWTKISFGTPQEEIRTIVNSDFLWYVSTNLNHVFYSANDGLNWHPINDNLTDSLISMGFDGLFGNQMTLTKTHVYVAGKTAIWKRPLEKQDTTIGVLPNIELESPISIFPNPTRGLFTIEGENISHLSILNSIGEIIYSKENEESIIEVDLNESPEGIYFLVLKQNGNRIIRKVSVY